ncbi:MAG: universal stress protein [Dehalococcoidales bacterium]|nr:universal stress protein [Dehalococcoidales bacterium]
MFERFLVPVDNSPYSDLSIEMAIAMGQKFGSHLVGCHVYAARLHDSRFRQMEAGLPDRYQEEGELQRQRQVHDSLITKGLQLISDSYLDVFTTKCQQAEVSCQRRVIEGTNYVELMKEAEANKYDLVVMGIRGLGAVEGSLVGSVCERVARRVRCDVLAVKTAAPLNQDIVVAVDGSVQSRAGLKAALNLAKSFHTEVEAVSVFDPHFHTVAFRSLAGVLSEEAGKIFRFREQEQLHEEVIHQGLKKIYQGHLDEAVSLARSEGMALKTTLLEGKPFQQILKHLEERQPSLLVVGRFGIHRTDDLDLGSTAENLLRLSPCHVLIASGEAPAPETAPHLAEAVALPWTREAETRLENIPVFARAMARRAIDDYARRHGYTEVTPEIMTEARGKMGM